MGESRYVFLDGIHLQTRIKALQAGERLTLVETGFGTGLNFLLTLQAWLDARTKHDYANDIHLHYLGIDAFPLRRTDLQQAAALHPALTDLSSALIADWPQATMGCHRIRWPQWRAVLDLWWETADDALSDLSSHGQQWIDAWYLDGFAPSRNEHMWRENHFRSMAALSKPGAAFATFTSAGDVRRGLLKAGFEVTKRTGFGRKRECLAGSIAQPIPTPIAVTPWDIPATVAKPQSALVVGAGLAGSCIARSLAERGIAVTVLERDSVAAGGSSNLQGLTYTRLSHRFSPLSDFSLAAYDFSTRLYHQHLRARVLMADSDAAGGGYLQLGADAQTLQALSTALQDPDGPVHILNPALASHTLGLQIEQQALYFPDALWLNPPAVCRERLAHPLITVLSDCGDVSLEPNGRQWRARWGSDLSACADIGVLATAWGLKQTPQTAWLPLQVIRGQVSHIEASQQSLQMRTSVCHEGYLPMARHGIHCLGATYGPNDKHLDEREADHQYNLQTLAKWLPQLDFPVASTKVKGHVALRCTTADYLPVAGPAADPNAFERCYGALSKKKTAIIDQSCPVIDGLWLLAGFGSRGLTAAPLAAECVAGQICGEPPVLPRYLQQAISPARFLKRAVVRGERL